jgi:hypothetical protein
MNEQEYGINVDHNDIRNPGFSIANKAEGWACNFVKIISQCTCFLHKVIKYKYNNIFVYLIFTNQNKTNLHNMTLTANNNSSFHRPK